MADEATQSDRTPRLARLAMRDLRRKVKKGRGEPLTSDDWAAWFELGLDHHYGGIKRLLRRLPSSPRCGICGAPFAGAGARVVRPFGFRPSRKNPHLCATCVESSPPGGTTLEAGVMFADVRGFTTLSESSDPEAVSVLLRKFYAAAEHVLFPEAVIDKLIGDEVMALYLPMWKQLDDPAGLMVRQARDLLEHVGYGTPEGPFVEVGVGLDFGEAFVGNIGNRSLYDFTAVGDVVNTASRLQGEARGGEIVLSSRVAAALDDPPGEPIEVTVKGKAEPVAARRVAVG